MKDLSGVALPFVLLGLGCRASPRGVRLLGTSTSRTVTLKSEVMNHVPRARYGPRGIVDWNMLEISGHRSIDIFHKQRHNAKIIKK